MTDQLHTILVVDDEPANLRMMERILRRQFRIITVSNGEDALEILRRDRVAMIITDQRMPGMTGIEMLRRSRDLCPDAVRMILTAYPDPEIFADALELAGVSRIVHKPFEPAEVLNLIKEAIDRRETVLESQRATRQLEDAVRTLRLSKASIEPLL